MLIGIMAVAILLYAGFLLLLRAAEKILRVRFHRTAFYAASLVGALMEVTAVVAPRSSQLSIAAAMRSEARPSP